jgi:phosphatidylserine decarboxylase
MKFAPDGYGVIKWAVRLSLIMTGIGLLAGGLWLWLLIGLAAFTTAFTLYFFRDPDRTTPADPDAIISPADGKVILIQRVLEPLYLKQEVTQVSIFLSPLNVHVNRIPLTGINKIFFFAFPASQILAAVSNTYGESFLPYSTYSR